MLQYLGTDYGAAVEDGRVVSEFEYQEMLDFSQVLVEQYQNLDPSKVFLGDLEQLQELIEQKQDWSEVRRMTLELVPRLSQRFNVVSYPTMVPSFSRGQELYRQTCARCHGTTGDGNGPSAAELDPPPRSFRDLRMNQLAPHQIFNALTFGVEGTDMPSHLESMSEQERWDVAFYVLTLRSDFGPRAPQQTFPLSLKDLATHSNDRLVSRLRAEGMDTEVAHLDYYRANPPGPSLPDLLILAQQRLDQSIEAFREGRNDQAFKLTLDAYLEGIEPAEPVLQQKNRALVSRLERQFSLYRAGLRAGNSPQDVTRRYQSLKELIAEARNRLAQAEAAGSFAFLQEALEGLTSLLAAAVLFSVSFWVIHQVDIRRWKDYIRRRAEEALSTGSGFALALAAFLAVYREALETVLFYEALWARSQGTHAWIAAGFVAGTLALVLLVFFMFQFGLRIPLKQFFAFTGVLLGFLAFVFAGYGVRELQAIGWIKETPLDWMVQFSLLEIWPTLESSALQVGILFSFLMGWFKLN